MDESWRCTMGAVLPRQRSSDGQHAAGHQSLAPDDFRDVFGGPPRTVLLSSFCGDAAAADYHAATAGHGGQYPYYPYGGAADALCRRDGRGRPASAAVPTEEGFFDDIFGARARQVRSRSRSKSTKSSSIVSSDEFGSGRFAFRSAATGGGRGDAALSSFASKLRPIAIPSRRYDSSPPSSVSTRAEYQSSFTCSTAAYPACRYYYGNGSDWTNHSGSSAASSAVSNNGAAAESSSSRHHRGASSGFCCFTSNPETSSREPSFRRTQRRGRARSPAADYAAADTSTECSGVADDYGYYYSPSSAASSSLFGNPPRPRPHRLEEAVMQEAMMMEVRERAPLLMDDDGDIDSVGAAAVDEAIAWAKERFWSQA
ncbi:hypothetical protein D1007_28885 [Hordeum vulgare]|nr:hypothetical protein D1007_28885 [Hordeum vulgare]